MPHGELSSRRGLRPTPENPDRYETHRRERSCSLRPGEAPHVLETIQPVVFTAAASLIEMMTAGHLAMVWSVWLSASRDAGCGRTVGTR